MADINTGKTPDAKGGFGAKRQNIDQTKACRDISELKDVAQKACNLFMSECKKRGINIFITETYRSQARQNYLYEQGRSRAGNIVTWTKKSNHTGGMAWDIACGGKVLYDSGILAKAGQVAKELGITWGGTWSTPDKPHFEVASGWKEPKEQTADSLCPSSESPSCSDKGYSQMGKPDKGSSKAEEEEKVQKIEISLNGKIKKVEAINKDGFNYVKLRDLADEKITVGYDNSKALPVVEVK